MLKKSEKAVYMKLATDDKKRFEAQMQELRKGIP